MSTQLMNEAEKLVFSNEKWLLLLREALSALNIALKKINRLKKFILKVFKNNEKENSVQENENLDDKYFSPTALSRLFQLERLRSRNSNECSSNELSSPTDNGQMYGYHRSIPQAKLKQERVKRSSVEVNDTSTKSEVPGLDNSKKSRKRRREERLNELKSCPINNVPCQEIKITPKKEIIEKSEDENSSTYYESEYQSTHSLDNSFCELSEVESKSVNTSEGDVLRFRFRINDNRIQDDEVKAEFKKEGFPNCFVKVKNKETYSRGWIIFSGDEIERAAANEFNIIINNEPLKLRKSVRTSSIFSPNSSIKIKSSFENVTEDSKMDLDPFVTESGRTTPKSTNEEFDNASTSTNSITTNATLNPYSSSRDSIQNLNTNITKDLALLSACSLELMKNMAESFNLGTALIGKSPKKTEKSDNQIEEKCGENSSVSTDFIEEPSLKEDNTITGIDKSCAESFSTLVEESSEKTEKSSTEFNSSVGVHFSASTTETNTINDCTKIDTQSSLKMTGSTPTKINLTQETNNSNNTTKRVSPTNTEGFGNNDAGHIKQSDIDGKNNSTETRSDDVLINISYGQPIHAGVDNDLFEKPVSTAPMIDTSNKNYKANNIIKNTSRAKNYEYENSKYKKYDDINKGYNPRAEIDERMLINISCGYPSSTKDILPKKGRFNEMGRNSPDRTFIYPSGSNTSGENSSKNTPAKDPTSYKNVSQSRNENIPNLNCSNTVNYIRPFNCFRQVNPTTLNKNNSTPEPSNRPRFEHNRGNNFYSSNRPPNVNVQSNNFRSDPPNSGQNLNRKCFNFHSNGNFSQNQRIEPWIRPYSQGGGNTGNRNSFPPFSPPSSSTPNHRNENIWRSNFNIPWRFNFKNSKQ